MAGWVAALGLSTAFASTACGSRPDRNGAPVLEKVADQVVAVNTELSVTLRASDIDEDPLQFGFTADSDDITARAVIESQGRDVALFRWTPLASDVGLHAIDFTVNDGKVTIRQTMTVDVRSATSTTAPVFVQPLGTGTTLDLTVNKCVMVPIEVEDPDSPGVTLGEEAPLIEGADLSQSDGLGGTWEWCPTDTQIAADDIYTLTLSADDGENPRVTKNFLIVLRKPSKPGCPGTPPVVQHSPQDPSTIVDIEVSASVVDDLGVKFPPQLLYSLNNPGSPPDVGMMTQVTMKQSSGDARDGIWKGSIPNPVASQPAGSSATIFYVIAAQDDDDAEGDCDHLTQVPDGTTFQIEVTNPGGGGGLGPCEACTADNQCGGAADTCIRIGTMGESFCGESCKSDGECPATHECSSSEITSVSGEFSRQCVPRSMTCGEPPPPTCMDDGHEDNDSRDAVMSDPPLAPGAHSDLVSCLADFTDDEDFYPIDLAADAEVTASVMGSSVSDLDIKLLDSTGATVASSTTSTSNESFTECLTAGRYYLRVYAFGDTAENPYTLAWSQNPGGCAPMCMDDSEEEDDDAAMSRLVTLSSSAAYTSTTNAICANDEDWFDVFLLKDDELNVTLTFDQQGLDEDLDLLLYKGQGGTELLTKCTETDLSGCDITNGQSSNSNERLVHAALETDFYYVVVRGWFDAENLYDICIGLNATQCPPP